MMIASDDDFYFYWSVDVPGLTRAQAEDLARYARTIDGTIGAIEADPKVWLNLSLDRSTVESLRAALLGGNDSGSQPGTFLETLEDWLSYADDDPVDRSPDSEQHPGHGHD